MQGSDNQLPGSRPPSANAWDLRTIDGTKEHPADCATYDQQCDHLAYRVDETYITDIEPLGLELSEKPGALEGNSDHFQTRIYPPTELLPPARARHHPSQTRPFSRLDLIFALRGQNSFEPVCRSSCPVPPEYLVSLRVHSMLAVALHGNVRARNAIFQFPTQTIQFMFVRTYSTIKIVVVCTGLVRRLMIRPTSSRPWICDRRSDCRCKRG